MRLLNKLRGIALLTLFAVLGGAAMAQEARQAVPTRQDIDAARTTIASLYDSAVKDAKTASQRSALARTILADSLAATTGAERYVMLTAALKLAADGDDAMLVLDACDRVADAFAVDRTSLLAEHLGKSNADLAPEKRAEWAEQVRKAFESAMEADKFDDAEKLLTALAAQARKGGDPKGQALTTALRKRLTLKRKQGIEREQLRKAAAAADAAPEDHEKLGRYECFMRNEWASGLPSLAQGDDAALAAAARVEIAIMRNGELKAAELIAAADSWARCDAKVSSADRTAIINHALDLYLRALPQVEGLDKVKVQRAVESLQKEAGKKTQGKGSWITVFRSDDSTIWNTDVAEKQTRYAMALDTLPEGIRYVRLRRASGQAVVLAVTNDQLAGLARGERFGWQGGKPELYKGTLLGIFDASKNLTNQPGVYVFGHGTEYFSGYGFGQRHQTVGPAVAVWDSKPIPGEAIEISVTTSHLSPDEQDLLLR